MAELKKKVQRLGNKIVDWLNAPVQEHREGFSVVVPPTEEQIKQQIMDNGVMLLGTNPIKLLTKLETSGSSAAIRGLAKSLQSKTFGEFNKVGIEKRLSYIEPLLNNRKENFVKSRFTYTASADDIHGQEYIKKIFQDKAAEIKDLQSIVDTLKEQSETFGDTLRRIQMGE